MCLPSIRSCYFVLLTPHLGKLGSFYPTACPGVPQPQSLGSSFLQQSCNAHLVLSELVSRMLRGSVSSGKCGALPHPSHSVPGSGDIICLDVESPESGAHILWQRYCRNDIGSGKSKGFSQTDMTELFYFNSNPQVSVSSYVGNGE